MLLTIQKFCSNVATDMNGFLDELQNEVSRTVTDEERRAWTASYQQVSRLFTQLLTIKPAAKDVVISTTDMVLEYKLPAASAWADVVLLGKGYGKQQVMILELKNYLKNNSDQPGIAEGLVYHNGEQARHPSDQVKGYVDYCRYFHSAVHDYKAVVNGCVYFTQDIDTKPYTDSPNDVLTTEYPMYNTSSTEEMAQYLASYIEEPDNDFATSFVNGYYHQNRNILLQVANALAGKDQGPFVLLDEQRRGFNLVMHALSERINDGKKQVIVVQGPPGSGKSAVAIQLWIEAVKKYQSQNFKGNTVFVTTSASQKDNWMNLFTTHGEALGAKNFIVPANQFCPYRNCTAFNDHFRNLDNNKYGEANNLTTLKKEYYVEYTDYCVNNNLVKNYKDNLHFLSIVDEAHALINPCSRDFSGFAMGWPNVAGPQAYHIIRESQVSVFFTDFMQSFRDQETTSLEDIQSFAASLGADFTLISLEGMQFRCAGSVDYTNFVDRLFTQDPLDNFPKWKGKMLVRIVDYPSQVDKLLLEKHKEGASVRLLSSYTEKWVGKDIDADHSKECPFDFDLPDENGKRYQKYWNNGNGYSIFVQGSSGAMSNNPLSEVGCAYTIRGFDYDFIGLLSLGDIIRRNGKWMINFAKCQETGITSKITAARNEIIEYNKAQGLKGVDTIPGIVDPFNPAFPLTKKLFLAMTQAYRVLMTRPLKGIVLYIQDEETRQYFRSLIH